jgi:hypothetical protein
MRASFDGRIMQSSGAENVAGKWCESYARMEGVKPVRVLVDEPLRCD